MAKFPARKLVASKATITAEIGSPTPRLTWSVCIDFHPVEYGEYEVECRLLNEYIAIPDLRDWRALGPRRLVGGPDVLDGSFLVGEWSAIDRTVLRIGARDGVRFPIEIDALVDEIGRVRTRCLANFTGVEVQPAIKPPPKTIAAAKKLAAQFVDLDALAGRAGKHGFFYFGTVEKAPDLPPAPPPPPIVKKPPPGSLKIAKGLVLMKIPDRPRVTKEPPKVKVMLGEYDTATATRRADCAIVIRRKEYETAEKIGFKEKLFVVRGTAQREVKGLDTAAALKSYAVSDDAVAVATHSRLACVSLPDGKITHAWIPPKKDGELFGGRLYDARRAGDRQLVVFTPKRVVLLDEKLAPLAEQATTVRNVTSSTDGRFVMVLNEKQDAYTLLGARDREIRVLATFSWKGDFLPINGNIGANEKGWWYVLDGHEALWARAFAS